jgi:hypothetical protein
MQDVGETQKGQESQDFGFTVFADSILTPLYKEKPIRF